MDPDLTSVLNTLSALSGTPTPAPAPTPNTAAPTPTTTQPTSIPPPTARTKTPPAAPASGPAAAGADPTKITTWPPALRYTTTKTQHHPQFQTRIKHLLASQRAHEQKWWEGREAVVRRVGEREGRRGEVEEVLRAVGAPIIDYKTNDDDLAIYDRKIYAASVSMAEALERELAALGVPFFCLSSSLSKQAGQAGQDMNGLKKRMLELLMDLVDDHAD